MTSIFYLISLFEKRSSLTDFISKVGELKKTFRGIYFIIPNDRSFKGVSVNTTNEKIDWVGVLLKESLSISKIIENYSSSFQKFYNHYDGETVLTFRGERNICLSCYLDGYVSSDEITDMKFSRLRLQSSNK